MPSGLGLASFDSAMRSFMEARNIPGASLALTRNGKLILARGYTFSNDSEDLAVAPDSLFRVASLAKPITAAAVLRLVQDGKLRLSAKLKDLLDLVPPPGRSPDPSWAALQCGNLLQHLGGWIASSPSTPSSMISAISEELGVSSADLQGGHCNVHDGSFSTMCRGRPTPIATMGTVS